MKFIKSLFTVGAGVGMVVIAILGYFMNVSMQVIIAELLTAAAFFYGSQVKTWKAKDKAIVVFLLTLGVAIIILKRLQIF